MDIGKKREAPETHNTVDDVAIHLFVEIFLSFSLRKVEIFLFLFYQTAEWKPCHL